MGKLYGIVSTDLSLEECPEVRSQRATFSTDQGTIHPNAIGLIRWALGIHIAFDCNPTDPFPPKQPVLIVFSYLDDALLLVAASAF